jgi:hypothetical protein
MTANLAVLVLCLQAVAPMANMLNFDDLKRLASVSGPCLTIFQPLQENYPLSVKQLTCIMSGIQKADKMLAEKGVDPAQRGEMLRPLIKVASNTDWTGRKGTLIMFRAPDCTIVNFWPDTLEARVHFGDEFFILPLLDGVASVRNFWLLALSINEVRLFRGSIKGLADVALPAGVPKSVSAHEQSDQPDHSLRNRSTAGPSVGNMKGVQFGTSAETERRHGWLHDYFKELDRGIRPILNADPQPLILAGVAREVALYREVNTWQPLVSGAVHGSHKAIDPKALFARAAQLIADYSEHTGDTSGKEMESAADRGLFLMEPSETIRAAHSGRIDSLFVSPEAPGFAGHETMVNSVALATIRNSGSVQVVHGMQLPEGYGAVLRYSRPEESIAHRMQEMAHR